MKLFRKHQKKHYTDSWNKYILELDKPISEIPENIRFVVLDTETTGFNEDKDRILSIGAIAINDLKITVSDYFEVYLEQEFFRPETVQVHGILKAGVLEKIEEVVAMEKFLAYLKNSVIIAHHADFDLTMLNNALTRIGLPKLKNKILDTGELFKKTNLYRDQVKNHSLDELCALFKINPHDRHTASGDAFLTALIFLKILTQLKKVNPSIKLKDLLFKKPKYGLL